MFSFTRLVPSKVQDTTNIEKLDLDLKTSIHVHLKVQQVKRPHFKMLTDRSGCGRLGTKVD